MVVLMLNPWFKDLSLVGDYVGHSFAIEIVAANERKKFPPYPQDFVPKTPWTFQCFFNYCARNYA